MFSQNQVINYSLNICKETNFELILENQRLCKFSIFFGSPKNLFAICRCNEILKQGVKKIKDGLSDLVENCQSLRISRGTGCDRQQSVRTIGLHSSNQYLHALWFDQYPLIIYSSGLCSRRKENPIDTDKTIDIFNNSKIYMIIGVSFVFLSIKLPGLKIKLLINCFFINNAALQLFNASNYFRLT